MIKRLIRILLYILLVFIILPILLVTGLLIGITPKSPLPPRIPDNIYAEYFPTEADSGLYILDKNWIRKNRYGLWELYVEGDAFNRGVAAGKLSQNLVRSQEEFFIDQINEVVPSKSLKRILASTISWMNRKMPSQIEEEFKLEIYGISLSATDEFNNFGTPYARLLNYHAAHDIGHALQSYYLVGCSSFAAWNERSTDSSLLIGRNFDFYFGDDFARDKIVEFVKPDTGFNFAFITWGGMAGVVSGMNVQGLTVTINAGTLELGRKAGTPVTLVAREILQFASSTEEAADIASTRNINVSETFMIGSAADNMAILIEKKPGAQYVHESDSSVILCTNHFQSDDLKAEPANVENRSYNATGYRFRRLQELVQNEPNLTPESVASVLRNKFGYQDTSIGYGNEKTINQFIAHHSVIFNPSRKIIWISTAPNVMGAYVAYDLDSIFERQNPPNNNQSIDIREYEIPADSFLASRDYKNFLRYRSLADSIRTQMKTDIDLPDTMIDAMISGNPDYYNAYLLAGDYYFNRKNYEKASINYKIAKSKEISSQTISDYLEKQIVKCK